MGKRFLFAQLEHRVPEASITTHACWVRCLSMMMTLFILPRSTVAFQLQRKVVFCIQYLFRKNALFLRKQTISGLCFLLWKI